MTQDQAETKGRSRNAPVMSVCFAGEGRKAVIVEVRGGQMLRKRLADRGFLAGEPVQVIKNSRFGGPVILEVRNTRFAIGRGEAQKILVTESPAEAPGGDAK